ncbi:hypothetical protein KL86SPO_70533 [uncultured Sporomusa sp.]|uniref:Glycosyltransferase 2-like domain-containing protein n=1 Tax=uncultured Sporomusa sp. TaxID=307249 RepID=A0A212M1M6_9FIRM|nr:glycosyltransferase family 2 protein [uncultured Sporomusa sp.]SCM83675.1 hypothetical protein KL86SPO_70533 [uncultured Sporomusa sp.]
MATVSVIIPVHNVEKYLRKCLESCCTQTLPDVEVIVVNDASPDHSAEIMREYRQRFPDTVRCLYLNENIKQGGARNRGLDIAKGEYVTFVDGDDYIAPDFCEMFYKQAKNRHADIIYGYFQNITEDGVMHGTPCPHAIAGLSREENINLINVSPVALLIKRTFFKNKNMRFPEKIVCEDIATTALWLLNASKVLYIDMVLYYRTIHSASMTQNVSLWSQRCYLAAIEYLFEKLVIMNLYVQYKYWVDTYILRNILVAIKNVYQYYHCDFQGFCNYARHILQRVKPDWANNGSIRRYLHPHMICFLKEIESGNCLYEGAAIRFERLTRSTENLYDCFQDELSQLLAWLNQQGCTKITVWGCGEHGRPLIKTLSGMGVEFKVTDKSEHLCGKVLPTGQMIANFADIVQQTDAILVTSHDYFKAIRREAQTYGNFIILNIYLYIKTGIAPKEVLTLYDSSDDFDYHTCI